MKGSITTIIRKELRRVFLDRRLALSIFVVPALSIALVYSLMGSMLSSAMRENEAAVSSIHAVRMPDGFRQILKKTFPMILTVEDIPAGEIPQIQERIQNDEAHLLLVFPEQFDRFLPGAPSIVEIYRNSVSEESRRLGYMVDGALQGYRQFILAQRLGSAEAVHVFLTENHDLALEHQKTGQALSMLLPMLLTLFLFAGAMQVGMDMIAGEKERGTLSAILLATARRSDIALGKMLSLAVVAFASCLSSIAGVLISIPFSNTLFGEGFEISGIRHYTAVDLLALLGIMAVLTLSFVSLICLASALAKSNKEAGAYISPLYIVLILMGFTVMFSNFQDSIWPYLLPIYGNIVMFKDILLFEADLLRGLLSCLSTLIFTGILVLLTIRSFHSERMITIS